MDDAPRTLMSRGAPSITRVPDPASAAADRIAARITAAPRPLRLAVPGGRTAVAVFRELAARPGVRGAPFELFFVDERAVPPDDPESNAHLARVHLTGPLGLPPERVHRMDAAASDLEASAHAYDALLARPLDLVLLGVGEDGHIASLFPGSPLIAERARRVAVVRDSPKPPPVRLTITPRVLEEAGEVVVVVPDLDKAALLPRIMSAGPPEELPARLVRARSWVVPMPVAR